MITKLTSILLLCALGFSGSALTASNTEPPAEYERTANGDFKSILPTDNPESGSRSGGACCVPNVGCWDVTSQEACVNWGGNYNEGVPCAQVDCGEQWFIGCCTDLGCFEVSAEECINAGGTIAGSIADCLEICPGEDETCCTPNGCLTMPVNTCVGFGGTPYQNMGDCVDDCGALVCGDGIIQPPEECESDSDCPAGEECAGCTCENPIPDCGIEGFKWLDENGDGSHQNGESGLPDWIITARDNGGDVLAATVTREGG